MGMDMVKAHFSASVFIAIDPIVIETPEGSLIQNLTIFLLRQLHCLCSGGKDTKRRKRNGIFASGNHTLETKELARGTYLVRIHGKNVQKTFRINRE